MSERCLLLRATYYINTREVQQIFHDAFELRLVLSLVAKGTCIWSKFVFIWECVVGLRVLLVIFLLIGRFWLRASGGRRHVYAVHAESYCMNHGCRFMPFARPRHAQDVPTYLQYVALLLLFSFMRCSLSWTIPSMKAQSCFAGLPRGRAQLCLAGTSSSLVRTKPCEGGRSTSSIACYYSRDSTTKICLDY